jgi:hypothetical protein
VPIRAARRADPVRLPQISPTKSFPRRVVQLAAGELEAHVEVFEDVLPDRDPDGIRPIL